MSENPSSGGSGKNLSRAFNNPDGFHRLLAEARELLDTSWHLRYAASRERLQDQIVRRVCGISSSASGPPPPATQLDTWCIFTAGPMGVGT